MRAIPSAGTPLDSDLSPQRFTCGAVLELRLYSDLELSGKVDVVELPALLS